MASIPAGFQAAQVLNAPVGHAGAGWQVAYLAAPAIPASAQNPCSASRESDCAFPQRPGRQHRPRAPSRPPPSAACPGPWPSYSVMSHRATIRSSACCGSRRVTRTGGRVRPAARLPARQERGLVIRLARHEVSHVAPEGRRIVNWPTAHGPRPTASGIRRPGAADWSFTASEQRPA